jgi:hypothetical protein
MLALKLKSRPKNGINDTGEPLKLWLSGGINSTTPQKETLTNKTNRAIVKVQKRAKALFF